MKLEIDKEIVIRKISFELLSSELEDYLNYLTFYQTNIEVKLYSNQKNIVFRVYIEHGEEILNQLSMRFEIKKNDHRYLDFNIKEVINILHFHLASSRSLGSFYSVFNLQETCVFHILCYSSIAFTYIKFIDFFLLNKKYQPSDLNGFNLIKLDQISKKSCESELCFIQHLKPIKEITRYKNDDELFSDLKYCLYDLNSKRGYKHESLNLEFIRFSGRVKLKVEFYSDLYKTKTYEFSEEEVLKLLYETYYNFSATLKTIKYIGDEKRWKIVYLA